jgi:hypothetical protein
MPALPAAVDEAAALAERQLRPDSSLRPVFVAAGPERA